MTIASERKSPILAELTGRINSFLYRQHVRRLTEGEIRLAQDWSLAVIRREHPHLNDEEVDGFYDRLLHVRVTVVDEWMQRMT